MIKKIYVLTVIISVSLLGTEADSKLLRAIGDTNTRLDVVLTNIVLWSGKPINIYKDYEVELPSVTISYSPDMNLTDLLTPLKNIDHCAVQLSPDIRGATQEREGNLRKATVVISPTSTKDDPFKGTVMKEPIPDCSLRDTRLRAIFSKDSPLPLSMWLKDHKISFVIFQIGGNGDSNSVLDNIITINTHNDTFLSFIDNIVNSLGPEYRWIISKDGEYIMLQISRVN